MRFLSPLLIAVLLAPRLDAQAVAADEKKEGFVSLFNGKDFSGWRFQKTSTLGTLPKNWSVADGVIHLLGDGNPHLASQWPYGDFDMRFEWKALKKGYNSGFYVRSGRDVGANQINLAEKDCGHLLTGPAAAKAVPELQKPAGEWNDWRVLAEGDKLTFWCNGKEAWSVAGFKPADGYVGIQAEGAAIDFKKIRIRELGWSVLGDLESWVNANGWTQDGDVFISGKAAGPLATREPHQKFTLRLEYQGALGGILFGADKKALVRFGEGELAKNANPAGQWNYLQATVAQGRATIWFNGSDLASPIDVSSEAGPIRIVVSDGLRLRNVRVRDAK